MGGFKNSDDNLTTVYFVLEGFIFNSSRIPFEALKVKLTNIFLKFFEFDCFLV